MFNRIFVLDHNEKPLMPCHPARARALLREGKAAVYRHVPFTIVLRYREGGDVQPVAYKTDPGSKQSGMALVADFASGKQVIFAAEIAHRGETVKQRLADRLTQRHSRRQRHTRYRVKRFSNRCRPKGWLPPSLRSRIGNIITWYQRFSRWSPISDVSMENVKFDTQSMQNPEISGVGYQQGTLQGYEVREYLLEKFKRTCAYCGKTGIPLEIEHIVPRSRGGSDRVSNLALACVPCNQKKGNRTAAEFGHPDVQKRAKAPLKDAAAVNSSRWALWRELTALANQIECGSGGRTKFNRTRLNYPKAHWIDAACVGASGEHVRLDQNMTPLHIKAMGRGNRRACRINEFGFPCTIAKTRHKVMGGFFQGDLVRGVKGKGKYAGITTVGNVRSLNAKGHCKVNKIPFSTRDLTLLQRTDGYDYPAKDQKHKP